jgi:hypothetical protein
MASRAASGDSAAALTARWNSRIAEDPSDPAASPGLAELAFDNFDYDQALTRYRRLVDSPGGPNACTVGA